MADQFDIIAQFNGSESDAEAALESARGEREGPLFLRDQMKAGEVEGATPHLPPSHTPISTSAFDMIVLLEVSSQAVYDRRFRGTIWPEGLSGVTIGIGYDLGFVDRAQFEEDWGSAIDASLIETLAPALGITGPAAKPIAAQLNPRVNIPFQKAIGVHREQVLPRWVAVVESALPNTDELRPDSLGALVSLTYNRGPSFRAAGDRFQEMREIRQHMADRVFDAIPDDFRGMKRIWPMVRGLQLRRDMEADLFQRGL